jgi:site-specific DNA-methyltransferase (adenine-specific)
MKVTDKINLYNCDNMEFMKNISDNYYDLAIVDPPYGIGFDGSRKSTSKHGGRKEYKFKGWDNETPKQEYFNELFRVSKNQIIWGANYFTKYLPSSMGWLFWDKGQRICNSDGELAYTSFQQALRVVEYNRCEIQKFGGAIHPTQKPVALYKWILDKYAKQGDKIFDSHLGSMSIAIAAHDYGFELDGCELDTEYYNKGIQRIKSHISQLKLFL